MPAVGRLWPSGDDDGDDVKFYDDLHLGSHGSRAVPVTLPSALCSPPAPDRPPVMRAVLIYFFMPGADDIRIEHPFRKSCCVPMTVNMEGVMSKELLGPKEETV